MYVTPLLALRNNINDSNDSDYGDHSDNVNAQY